jgi:hypothetical protein
MGPETFPLAYHLYFLGGQSNMAGFGSNSELPSDLEDGVPGVCIFHGNPAPDDAPDGGVGIWASLRPGHGSGFATDGQRNEYSERFGVELSFAQRLLELEPNQRIVLIKYARDGTSLDSLAAAEYGSWEPDYGGPRGTNQYDHYLKTLRSAWSNPPGTEECLPGPVIPSGIVWMQGEGDALDSAAASAYGNRLKRLMDLMRASLLANDLPVVIGSITDSGGEDVVWSYGTRVQVAQREFVERDGRAALVTSTSTYGYSDPWHYDSPGYLDLGRRFAEEMVRLRRK